MPTLSAPSGQLVAGIVLIIVVVTYVILNWSAIGPPIADALAALL